MLIKSHFSKMVTLNRMMVYRELLQCARTTPSDDNLQITIDCVKAVRTTDGNTLCHSRESCRNTYEEQKLKTFTSNL